jgi:hypothetical protein
MPFRHFGVFKEYPIEDGDGLSDHTFRKRGILSPPQIPIHGGQVQVHLASDESLLASDEGVRCGPDPFLVEGQGPFDFPDRPVPISPQFQDFAQGHVGHTQIVKVGNMNLLGGGAEMLPRSLQERLGFRRGQLARPEHDGDPPAVVSGMMEPFCLLEDIPPQCDVILPHPVVEKSLPSEDQ